MRHHEAFMDAFIKYVKNRTLQIEFYREGKTERSNATQKESCRIETVSNVTYNGNETLTISIGSGALIHYDYEDIYLNALSSEGTMQIDTVLRIAYQNECDNDPMTSIHEYHQKFFTINDNSGEVASLTDFNYECSYTEKKE